MYKYGVHRRSHKVVYRRCTTRNAETKCNVTVKQEGDLFVAGKQLHLHGAETGAAVKAVVVRDIKTFIFYFFINSSQKVNFFFCMFTDTLQNSVNSSQVNKNMK